MSFLTPLYLIGGALITLPIVLHLLRRDVAPPVPFTAVRLLRRSAVERSRRHRLRDLLLLAARVTALLLLAGSFARPYIARAGSTGRATVVLLDRSFSMSAPGRFARAQQLAREAIDQARGDRVSLVAFDDRAAVVAPPGSSGEARAAVATVAPGFGATRYAAAFDKAAELLADERAGRVVLVGDLQRNGFDPSTGSGHAGGAVLPDGIDLVIRDAGAPAANLSVTSAAIERRQLTATVHNFGGAARTVDVRAFADGHALSTRRVSVPASEAVDLVVDAPSDIHAASVSVDDAEGYAADNERFALADAPAIPRVVIVGGGPAANNGFYFSRALLATDSEVPDFDVRTVSGTAFSAMTPQDASSSAAIAILSTHGLDRRAGDTLRRFVSAGGGLFIAAGPDVDPAVLSALLDWQPALVPVETPNAGVLAASDLRHPVLRPFDAVAANFGQVTFARVWQIDGGSQWRTVARFTNGAPALAERKSTGRVLLFTSDVDRRWNDFPLHPTFVPFVQEIARYLGARAPSISSFLIADAPAGVSRPGITTLGGRSVAVNVDARESAVDRLSPEDFRAMVGRSADVSKPREQRLAAQTEARQNYWRYGLLLMLGVLVLEAFVGAR